MSVEKRPRKPHVIRVLAVDDHEIVRKGLKAVLDLVADIELVGEAENGRLALGLARKLKPDVILMDLMMPEMDGIEAMQRLRELEKEGGQRTPIIASSSHCPAP